MLLTDITNLVKKKLAGEFVTYNDIKHLLDETIDDINETLSSTYPVFSDLEQGATEYTYFPDKYIRQVCIIGVASKFYEEDEEGETSAFAYNARYIEGLASMTRDYIHKVPEEYQDLDKGYMTDSRIELENMGGVVLYDEDYGL